MFTLSNAYENPKHSKLTRLKNRIKFSTYSIMHELLQCQFHSSTLFNLLILVEAGQFLWFAIHPDYTFLWQTSFAQYPRDIVKYLQVDALFREGDVGVYYTVLYLFAAVILAILLCIIFILIKFNASTKKNSTIVYYLLRLLSLCTVLLITIGPIPLFQTFLEALTCESDDPLLSESECYKGIHLANTVCGALALFFTVGLTIISQLLFIDFNPASKIPFAGPQSIIGFFKLALKFGITLYYTLDHDLSGAKTFVIIYAILWLFTLILRYTSRGYYNEHVNIVATITECIVTWAAVTCVFHAYVDAGQVDDIGLYFFLCAAPFAGYTYYIIFMYQRLGGMRINVRKMKKIYEIEKFLNIACALVENKEKPQARIELEGILRYHTRTCRKDPNDCLCYYLSQNIANSDPNGEEKKLWYRFLNSLISDAIVKFPKNCHLRLQHAYFQQDRVGNNFKALFELMKSEEVRPDIQEEFSVFRYKNIIEKEMLEKDIRNANSRGIDVNMIVHFQEKFVIFQKEVGKSVKMQLNFWQELEQSTPNVQQLLLLGSKITVQAEIVKNAYSQLSTINSNHIRMLKIYGNFLQDIMNDSFEAQRILEKAEYAEKSMNLDKGFLETDRLKYSENSKTCIIMCSGNIHTMGKVLDANTETMNMLNFTHTEIIGQSVNQIMPEIIGVNHDALMMKYFDTCVPSVIGRERPVFPMNKGGYIIPCSLMIKIYPNLDHGIRVVGFMRKVESNSSVTIKPKVGEEIVMNSLRTHYIMYGGENNEIYAVTEGCYDSFGIPSSLANGTDPEFTIETIFPELNEDDNESMKTTSGLLTMIDTTSLPENFLVGLNPVDSIADSQTDKNQDLTDKEKMARYRSAQVRVTLIEDSNFLGKLRIKIIKLVEVADSSTKQVHSAVNNDTDETPIHRESEDNLKITHESASDNGAEADDEQQIEARSEASNFSLMMGEDMRQLKDMKAKISEKNTPSSITFLKATSLIMAVLLIALTATQLSKKNSFNDQLAYGFQAVKTSVMRHYYMADINYFSRLLFGSEGGYLGSIDIQSVRDYLRPILEEYEEAEFEVSQAKMIQNQTDKNAPWIRLNTYNLLPDGTIALHNANINHAYYLYLSSAQRYLDIPFSEFHSSDGTYTTAESAFYYIRRNGLTTLRAASESVALQYSGYYEEKTHKFTDFCLATMLVGITFLLAAMLIMLPKIFSVNKTNMKVLSLFGYILPQEVQKLAEKCEQYMEEYLDEAAFQRDYSSYFSENNSEEHQQLTKQPDESLIESPHHKNYLSSVEEAQNESITSGGQDFTLQMKEFSEHEDFRKPPVLISARSVLHSPGRSMVMSSTTRDDKPLINIKLADETHRSSISVEIGKREDNKEKKENEEKEENEELQEYLHERSKKLRNSPDHSKKGVIIKMGIFASIFVGYFLGDFLHELFFFRNYRYAISHLALICERSSDLKFAQTFTQEEIYENNLTSAYPTYPAATVATTNIRTEYFAKVLANQVSIKDSYTLPFPYQFDKYFETLLLYDNDNMCDAYYTDKTLAAYTNCLTAGEGKLKLGMIQAETSIIGTLDTLIKDFYKIANRDKQTQIDYLTSGDLFDVALLVARLKPIQDYLLEMFVEANNNYLDDTAFIEEMKLIAFLVVLFVLQAFVLFPYLERLRQHIFRTKALLNMIPMSMLKKNKTLAETFVSKEVFQALK